MLTYEDCVALSDLTAEEIDAIREHEHLSAVVAAELGNYLLHTPNGVPVLKRMILDDIAAARARSDWKRALELRMVLRHFVQNHPDHKAARGDGTGITAMSPDRKAPSH